MRVAAELGAVRSGHLFRARANCIANCGRSRRQSAATKTTTSRRAAMSGEGKRGVYVGLVWVASSGEGGVECVCHSKSRPGMTCVYIYCMCKYLCVCFPARNSSPATTEAAGYRTSIKRFDAATLSESELATLMQRPRIDFEKIFARVKPIIADVQSNGDAAVVQYTEKFDNVALEQCVVPVADMAEPELDDAVKQAFDVAFDNIAAFHTAQKSDREAVVETMPGVKCMRVARPVEAVGVYVPGGARALGEKEQATILVLNK